MYFRVRLASVLGYMYLFEGFIDTILVFVGKQLTVQLLGMARGRSLRQGPSVNTVALSPLPHGTLKPTL